MSRSNKTKRKQTKNVHVLDAIRTRATLGYHPGGVLGKPTIPSLDFRDSALYRAVNSCCDTGGPADTFKKPVPQYTGDKMIGISVVHKSGLQPVFSNEQAVELAKMRRG